MSKHQVININLSTRLAPILEQAIYSLQTLVTISGIMLHHHHHHHRFNHQVPLSVSTLSLLSQVLTIRERRRFKLIPIQLEGYS